MSHMFIPGPVDVTPDVRGTEAKLKKVFMTEARIFQPPASGTGMQEAGIRNLVEKDVLSCINGAFSERWYQVAVTNGGCTKKETL